jgi:hypothetical protein
MPAASNRAARAGGPISAPPPLPPARVIAIWNGISEAGFAFGETLIRFAAAIRQEAAGVGVPQGRSSGGGYE